MNKVVWHAKFDTDREAAAGINAALDAGILNHGASAQIYPSLSFDAGGDDKSYVVLIAGESLDPNTLGLSYTFERITEMEVADETVTATDTISDESLQAGIAALKNEPAPEGEW